MHRSVRQGYALPHALPRLLQWSVGLATEMHRLSFGGSYRSLVALTMDVAGYRLVK